MRPLPRCSVWLALVLGLGPEFCALVHGQAPPPAKLAAGTTNVATPFPQTPPVDMFRELLAMNNAERERYLTNRPPAVRGKIEQKLREYEAMKPGEREARLTATQLRWYLEQFIMTPPVNRAEQLARVPSPYREILKERLGEFDLLPPPLQKEMLEHEMTRTYFLGQAETTNQALPPSSFPPLPGPLNNLSRVPAAQREEMYASLKNYFELEEADKQKVLDTLPAPERQRVEKTLQAMERLPKEQRDQGLQSIDKLASLTDEQRRVFLSNVGRWKEMPPAEREAWLKLVGYLPPQAPANLLPPPSMILPSALRPNAPVATNPTPL